MVARFLKKRSVTLYMGMISLFSLKQQSHWTGYPKNWNRYSANLGTEKELLSDDLKVIFAILLLPCMLYRILHREKEYSCPDCN